MDKSRDRVTDYAAIALSIVISGTLWAMFVYQWYAVAPVGEVTPWLRNLALLFSMLALLTLFGAEKLTEAVRKISGGS